MMLPIISLARSLARSLSRALSLNLSRGESVREGSKDEANLHQDYHGSKQDARNPLHAQQVPQYCHKSRM